MSDTHKRDIDAVVVATWLREHPTFLSQFPDVALAIELPREQGKATSLASYQLDVLREKNRELNRRLQDLIAVANENERLTVRTHQFTLALMRAHDLPETLTTLVASLREDFNSQWLRVLLVGNFELQESPWWRVLQRQDPALAPFAEFLAADEPLCGRVQVQKLDVLFGADADSVQSTALLPLGKHGILAIGSDDANRFYPGMGTMFLRLMGQAVIAALARHEKP